MRIKIDSTELYDVLDAASGYRDEGLINLRKGGILLRMHEYSNTAMYAALIPEDVMEEYERGEYNELGVDIEKFKDFVPKKNGDVLLTLENHRLKINTGQREYQMGLIDPDAVAGVPKQVPDLDLGVKVYGEPDWFLDFVNEAYSKVYENDDKGVYISSRDGVLYLWAKDDINEMTERLHWEDFDDYEIDWSKCSKGQAVTGKDLDYSPEEDHITNAIISTAYLRPIKDIEGDTRVEIDNWMPMKVVTETESGVKHSWMIPPRVPQDGVRSTVPDRIIKDRSVVE